MPPAPKAAYEADRLQALRELELLDTEEEAEYNDIVSVAAKFCDMPVSAISLIADNRQWFKARRGLDVAETPRAEAFCAHTILQPSLMEVPDATRDARFADNPLVVGGLKIRFYAGMPLLTPDGQAVGALCVIDSKPRKLTKAQIEVLKVLGRSVEHLMTLRKKIRELTQAKLETSARITRMKNLDMQRRDLVSMVVHDLKNPLAVVANGVEALLEDEYKTVATTEVVSIMASAVGRARQLVTEILRSAQEEAQIIGEIKEIDLKQLLVETVAQMSSVHRRIQLYTEAKLPSIFGDAGTLQRVLINLIDNAIKYSPGSEVPVELCVRMPSAKEVLLQVKDQGDGICDDEKERVLGLFSRGQGQTRGDGGHGIGLYFCRSAIEAHSGVLWLQDNSPKGTVVNIKIPVKASTHIS